MICLMKKSLLLLCLCFLFIAVFLSSCSLPFISKKKKAGLQVNSSPKATVFLNDEHVGQTPYFDENLKPGEYTLKLVPETNDSPLLSWQGAIKLSSGILTVVDRKLGENEEQSSGYVLTLEPIAEKDKIRVSVISTPDSVVVSLDGEPKGFSPLSLDNVVEGEHVLTISSSGFREEVIKAKTVKGHKLMISVQLAKESALDEAVDDEEKEDKEEDKEDSEKEEAEVSPKPKASPKIEEDEEASSTADEMEKPYVKIKNTPTGWLNIRSEPSTSGGAETVITKVNPGEVYKFIEQNESGWCKIEYEEDKQGWTSGTYVTLYR
jgi:hypothetical protein